MLENKIQLHYLHQILHGIYGISQERHGQWLTDSDAMTGLSSISAAWSRAILDLPYSGEDGLSQATSHLESLPRGPHYWSSITTIPAPGPILADIKTTKSSLHCKKRIHNRIQRGKTEYQQKRAYDSQRTGQLNQAILGETVTPYTMECITLSDGTQCNTVQEVH